MPEIPFLSLVCQGDIFWPRPSKIPEVYANGVFYPFLNSGQRLHNYFRLPETSQRSSRLVVFLFRNLHPIHLGSPRDLRADDLASQEEGLDETSPVWGQIWQILRTLKVQRPRKWRVCASRICFKVYWCPSKVQEDLLWVWQRFGKSSHTQRFDLQEHHKLVCRLYYKK